MGGAVGYSSNWILDLSVSTFLPCSGIFTEQLLVHGVQMHFAIPHPQAEAELRSLPEGNSLPLHLFWVPKICHSTTAKWPPPHLSLESNIGREELRMKKQDTYWTYSEQTSHGGLFKVKKHQQQIETLQFHDGVSRPKVCHQHIHYTYKTYKTTKTLKKELFRSCHNLAESWGLAFAPPTSWC